MREILFRGKQKDDGCWIYGSLQCFKGFSIFDEGYKNFFTVSHETIGQYTGIDDKNGMQIFEGDIVTFKTSVCNFKPCVVEYSNAEARFVARIGDRRYAMTDSFVYEIIGNIHDNPELIGGKEE